MHPTTLVPMCGTTDKLCKIKYKLLKLTTYIELIYTADPNFSWISSDWFHHGKSLCLFFHDPGSVEPMVMPTNDQLLSGSLVMAIYAIEI